MSEDSTEKEIGWILKEKYNGKTSPLFFRDVERLSGGEPLDYIIGHTSFLSSKIDLSERPLIPRTETEFWVEKAIGEILVQKHTGSIRCLDIFSGSGCIGISLLRHIPFAEVTFGEKYDKYIQQIKGNLKLNDIDENRAEIVQSDLFASLKGPFDYIFANPPYIAKDRLHTVEKSVLSNEPHEALFAEDNGLFYVKVLLDEAHEYLLPHGRMYIEFDSWQQKDIEEYLNNMPRKYSDVAFWDDVYGRPRVVVVIK